MPYAVDVKVFALCIVDGIEFSFV